MNKHRLFNFLYCMGSLFSVQNAGEFIRAKAELKFAKEREYSQVKLESTTCSRLQRIITHAYETVPFYQALWKRSGVNVDQIATINDLSHLPLVSKSDFREQPIHKLLSQTSSRTHLLHTSGSTGTPRLALKDVSAQIYNNATVCRYFAEHGVSPGSTILFLYSTTRAPIRHRAIPNEHWTHRIWISLWDLVESPTLITQVKPDVVIGSPQQLEAVAKLVYSARRIRPPKVFVNVAERLDSATRHRIESETGASVVDVYCSSELSTLIAFQCRNYNGFHTNSDYVIVEVVDSTGRRVEPGQEGEIVVTDLCNYVAPVIRYRLGDVATVATSTCDCGRALPTLIAKINGRVVDQIKLPNGRILNAMPLVDNLQASVGCPLTLIQNDHSNFTLKCYSTYPIQPIVKKDWIEQKMLEYLDVSIEVQICIEELSQALHNSPGKIRPFLSCLPREEHEASVPSNKATHLELGSHGDIRPVYHPTKEN